MLCKGEGFSPLLVEWGFISGMMGHPDFGARMCLLGRTSRASLHFCFGQLVSTYLGNSMTKRVPLSSSDST